MNPIDKHIQRLYASLNPEQTVRLNEIARAYHGEDELIPSSEILTRMRERPPEEPISTGFAGLDRILRGFYLKQLVVVAAATKSGKTTMAVEMTINMAEHNPTWLPFEESAEELIQKFLDRGEEPPAFFTPATMKGDTLLWVEKKIIEARAKYDSKVIFIDHLHFIVPFTSERHDLAIGRAMRELKRMAKQWNIIIVLIAHLKKTRMETPPTLDDLRDSSFVAQEADTVLMLYRNAKREKGHIVISNEVTASVQANRRTGKTGIVTMVYNEGHLREEAWEQGNDFGDWQLNP